MYGRTERKVINALERCNYSLHPGDGAKTKRSQTERGGEKRRGKKKRGKGRRVGKKRVDGGEEGRREGRSGEESPTT